jgi:hypothetical protein
VFEISGAEILITTNHIGTSLHVPHVSVAVKGKPMESDANIEVNVEVLSKLVELKFSLLRMILAPPYMSRMCLLL